MTRAADHSCNQGGNTVNNRPYVYTDKGRFCQRVGRFVIRKLLNWSVNTVNIIDELEWRDAINQQPDAESGSLRMKNPSRCTAAWTNGRQHAYRSPDSLHHAQTLPACRPSSGHSDRGRDRHHRGSSGRQTERSLQTLEQVQANVDALTGQMKSSS